MALVEAETPLVLTVNGALVAPSATVTLVGTVALGLSLVRVTTAPPAGAALLKVAVPELFAPPITEEGVSVKEEEL